MDPPFQQLETLRCFDFFISSHSLDFTVENLPRTKMPEIKKIWKNTGNLMIMFMLEKQRETRKRIKGVDRKAETIRIV